jgi:hypothetical protein
LFLGSDSNVLPTSSFGDSIAAAALRSGKTSGDILASPGLAGNDEIEVDNGVKAAEYVSMILSETGAGEQVGNAGSIY